MPFRPNNATSLFHPSMDVIPLTIKYQFGLVYLDDIVIFSKSVSDHFSHLHSVPGILFDACVLFKLIWCFFFGDKIDYPGHVIKAGKLIMSDKETDSIRELKQPTNMTDLKLFLDLCNVSRRFVPNSARFPAPLNKKRMKYQPFHFDDLDKTEIKGLLTLQDKLLSSLLLAFPRPTRRYTWNSKACNKRFECVWSKPNRADLRCTLGIGPDQ